MRGYFFAYFLEIDMALRTPLTVSPHMYIGDSTGRPLDNGMVYFGLPDQDPEYYPIPIFSDDELTVPVTQPVRTKGGYLNDNKGDMAEIHAQEIIYSVKVLDQYGRKIFYKGQSMRSNWNDDVIIRIDEAIISATAIAGDIAAEAVREAIDGVAIDANLVTDALIKTVPFLEGSTASNQRKKNLQTFTPYDFGLIGGYSTLTLGDKFSTLAAATAVYSNAVALTELHDRVVFDRFIMHLIDNQVDGVDMSCQIRLDKPLKSYLYAKTKMLSGNLEIKPHVSEIEYCLHISTPYVVHTGRINIFGEQSDPSDMRTRRIKHGVVFGSDTRLGLTGDAPNCSFNYIEGNNLLGFAYVLAANCHFTQVNNAIGRTCGSAFINSNQPLSQGLLDTFTSVTAGAGSDINQRSILSVPALKLTSRMFSLRENSVVIDKKPYEIMAIDFTAKTLTVYPALPASKTSGELIHVFGGAAAILSNNTACSTMGVTQGIVCGYTLFAPALYGVAINSFISEYCGIAISVAGINDPHIGTNISLAYFEGNYVDILYRWQSSTFGCLNINQSIALDYDKIWNLFGYTVGDISRADYSLMGAGHIHTNGKVLEIDGDMFDLSTPSTSNLYEDLSFLAANTNIYLKYIPKIAELTGLTGKTVYLKPNGADDNHQLTLLPPTGMTINDAANFIINMSNYIGLITVAFYFNPTRTNTNIKVVVSGQKRIRKGATPNRPLASYIGELYYDTTLLPEGKPISWNGSAWVDALGATV